MRRNPEIKKLLGTLDSPPGNGGFVYEVQGDSTTWHELEWIVRKGKKWRVYTVPLDQEIPHWGNLAEAAGSVGISFVELGRRFESDDPMERANAWEIYGDSEGWDEVDDTWEELDADEVNDRYSLAVPVKDPVPTKIPPLDNFTDAYITAALWSTNDESTPAGGVPLDQNYGIHDIHRDTLKKMIEDCERFQAMNMHDLDLAYQHSGGHGGYAPGNAGHDFWLTRGGHGTGFWDRGLGDVGDRLTKVSEKFGEFNLYVGDDGKIHGS